MASVRMDKWLWAARFFKTRSLAARACELGRIQSNGQPAKAARDVRIPETYQWLLVPTQESPQAPVGWQSIRLSGQDALAERASKKLRNDELMVTNFASSRLRMELDRVPLWRGDHVAIRQLIEDFGRYLYLPRLQNSVVLLNAIGSGLGLLTWEKDSFAYAEAHDESAGRYRGLRFSKNILVSENDPGLLVKPEAARRQIDAEIEPPIAPRPGAGGPSPVPGGQTPAPPHVAGTPQPPKAKRYHGTVILESARVGRDAGRIADEVVTHLVGLVGSSVKITLEIEAQIPGGVPDNVVRTVTENSRALKFTSSGFEKE